MIHMIYIDCGALSSPAAAAGHNPGQSGGPIRPTAAAGHSPGQSEDTIRPTAAAGQNADQPELVLPLLPILGGPSIESPGAENF
jgi:hypothetical protein